MARKNHESACTLAQVLYASDCGQRELVIGDCQTGEIAIAIDACCLN